MGLLKKAKDKATGGARRVNHVVCHVRTLTQDAGRKYFSWRPRNNHGKSFKSAVGSAAMGLDADTAATANAVAGYYQDRIPSLAKEVGKNPTTENQAELNDMVAMVSREIADLLANPAVSANAELAAHLNAMQHSLSLGEVGRGGMPVRYHHGLVHEAAAKKPLRTYAMGQSVKPGTRPEGSYTTVDQHFGSGAINSVMLVEKDGQKYIFKADQQAMVEPLMAVRVDTRNKDVAAFSDRAVGMKKLDDLLGFGVVPVTHHAVHEGLIGHVMGLAPGSALLTSVAVAPSASDAEVYNDAVREGGGLMAGRAPTATDTDGVRTWSKNVDAFRNVDMSDPSLQDQLTALQLLDILAGQVDRHAGNYFVGTDGNGRPIVTAIDNDAAFGHNTDISKPVEKLLAPPPVVSKEQADAILGLSDQQVRDALAGLLSTAEIDATVARLNALKDHISNIDWVTRFDADTFRTLTSDPDSSYVGREVYMQRTSPGAAGIRGLPTRPEWVRARPYGGARPTTLTQEIAKEAVDLERHRAEDKEAITNLSKGGNLDGARDRLRPLVNMSQSLDQRMLSKVELGRARDRYEARKILVDQVVGRLDVTSDKPLAFWSGDVHRAGEEAARRGMTILEQTPGASVINGWDDVNQAFPWQVGGSKLWGDVSSNYAMGASGPIEVFQNDARYQAGGGYVWKTRELPVLLAQNNVTTVTFHNLDAQAGSETGRTVDLLSLGGGGPKP